MARKTKEELKEIMEHEGVSRLWSWSRVNCFQTSKYEYFLKYVLHEKEDNTNCVYAPMGSICHQIIEDFYNGDISYDDMFDKFEDGWLTSIDIADLKFDRNDEEKNAKIAGKYKFDLQHFFKHHRKIEHNIVLEKFITTKIGDSVLQGYVDAVFKDDDGCFNIVDWKTSTKYSGKTAEEKSGQLVVYAIGLNQAGVPMDKIKICWNFLKYCTIRFEQANGQIKTRDVERYKLGESLQSNAKMWLKKLGYEDEVDSYLKMLLDANGIEVLPEEVQAKYSIEDCYVYVPLTDKLVCKWQDEIIATIKNIELCEKDYEETNNDKIFWDDEDSVKAESYYFATLSGYSANKLKPYAEYLNKLEKEKSNDDIFSSLGFGVDKDSSSVIESVPNNKAGGSDVDLSWLDEVC